MRGIAIDVGSGMTKVMWNGNCRHFPSLSGVPKYDGFDLEETKGATVEFDDKIFVVGERARLLVAPRHLANTRDDQWFETDAYLALFYAALAEAVEADYSGRLRVCTGLPQATYGNYKEALIERLGRKHAFRIDGKKRRILLRRADVQVMPQVMGLFISQLARDKSLQVQKVALIDVGTYTSDWTIVEDCKTVHWASGGLPVGIANVIRGISEYLRDEHGMKCSDAAVADAVRSRRIRKGSREIDLSNQLEEVLFSCAAPMIEAVEEQWEGAKDATIIVGGGGGPLFSPAIRTHFAHARVIDDEQPFYSVVAGYHTYLAQHKRQKAA